MKKKGSDGAYHRRLCFLRKLIRFLDKKGVKHPCCTTQHMGNRPSIFICETVCIPISAISQSQQDKTDG